MSLSLQTKKLYNQFEHNVQIFFAFLIYVILLDRAFAYYPIFLTAGIKPGHYLSPSVVEHPLRSTKNHRLGQLLPAQQPNSK